MREGLKETAVIFVSVVKWSVLAGVVGCAVGLSTTVFLKALNWSTTTVTSFSYYYLLLPFAFFLSDLLIKYLAPEAEGHGTEKVIEAIHRRSGKIKAAVIPVKLVASVITVAFGGSAGKEGPCAQIGGGLASVFSDIFRFDDADRKKLVICGISAGFSSVFGTPIAGAIFGVEVLFVGGILYDVLLPSFIAGVVGYHIARAFGITYFYHPRDLVPSFHEYLLVKVIGAAVFFGFVSFLTVEAMRLLKGLASRIKVWNPLKGLIGGLLLVVLTLIFSQRFLGLGVETIHSTLQGTKVGWDTFLLKIFFTAVTLNFGGSGGVITPLLFIGATAGSALSNLLKLDPAMLSAIGLVSVLAGATNAPIASSIMAIEFFGAGIAPYAALSCIISFLITGHRSIYPAQVLGIKKSPSIAVEVGKEISEIEPKVKLRRKSVVRAVLIMAQRVKEKVRKS